VLRVARQHEGQGVRLGLVLRRLLRHELRADGIFARRLREERGVLGVGGAREEAQRAVRGRHELHGASVEAGEQVAGRCPEARRRLVVVVGALLGLARDGEEEARVVAARLGRGRDPSRPGDERPEVELRAGAGEPGKEALRAARQLGPQREQILVQERRADGR